MKLTDAFRIHNKELVSFVGGGGKTTAMFRLADELAAQGKRVVTTTTTRIFAAQIQLAPFHLVAESDTQIVHAVRAAIQEHPHLLVIGATNDQDKALGIAPELVDQLFALDEIDAVLVEADGARMRPFKAPADHEPVVPARTSLLVPVVGIDAVGKPNTDDHVHRAERIADVADIAVGMPLQPGHLARIVGSERGGLKNKPPAARAIPLINKVSTAEQLDQARRMAEQLLTVSLVEAVAVGAVKNPSSPVARIFARVAAIILAAGGSTRMEGAVKQLLPWRDSTLVGNAVRVAQQSGVSDIVVVTGNRDDRVREALQRVKGVHFAHNPDWATGRASSVRTGLAALDENIAGALFINADQPFLTPQIIALLEECFAVTRAPIVVPTYEGKTGSPVLFARELFEELRELQGEQGGRDILQKYQHALQRVPIDDVRAAVDLDTPAEYRGALERIKDEG